jgi:hypothetical protein
MTLVCSDAQQSACEAGLSKMPIVIRSNGETMDERIAPVDHGTNVRNAYKSPAHKLVFPQVCPLLCAALS